MKRQWAVDELVEHWTLLPDELAQVANKTGATRLGFALLLKWFQQEARFPQAKHEIPSVVVAHVAKQVDVPVEHYAHYNWEGRTIEYHRAQIRAFLGFREATVQDSQDLMEWLCAQVLPSDHQLEHLQAAVSQRCRTTRIEPPTPSRIDRLIRTALHTYEEHLCAAVLQRLSPAMRERLDALVPVSTAGDPTGERPDGRDSERSALPELKADPGPLGLESVLTEIAKLARVRNLEVPADLFGQVSPKVLQGYRQRAAAEAPSELRAHPTPIRLTLLAALCCCRGQEITDGLVDLLIALVHRIGAKAERKVEKELLNDLKRVGGKVGLLFQLANAAVAHPEGIIREVLYPVVGEQTLRDLVKEFKATGPAYRLHVQTHLRASYRSHYRRMLPPLLGALEFRSNNTDHQPVIRAIAFLKRHADDTQRFVRVSDDVPITGIIRSGWRDLVVQRDQKGRERVDRITYEICVLQALRDHLRCKEIWVVGADRYRNPEEDLPSDFAAQRTAYYAALHQPLAAETFLATLQTALTTALAALDRGLPKNPAVTLLNKNGGWIAVSPLDPQPEPVNLAQLKAEIGQRWPMTSLLDILKETDLRVGFTEHLTSVVSRETLDRTTLQKRLLLCLYGLGTNTGLKRVSAGEHGESYPDLRYARRRFIAKDQVRTATAHVVNAILHARLPQIWGEGTTACASDSQQFGAWDQNLLTEWHVRYGGRGVMIYWHVERKATCIYSQLKTCSSSEVAAMIEGVLRHCTEMVVEKNYVDSHGQSEVAFAFCYLLGFHLLPRLKGLHAQKLYRPETGKPEAYPHLQPVLTRPINWEIIRQQYDQMIKYATALRLGTAETEAILRRFTRGTPQHPTYQALAELGKAVKTVFLCQYLQAEALRREIHEGLNVVENWNSANSFIFYGKGGEIATNRLDDQELAVVCLHLLQNCLVYVNTLMIQRVLTEPPWADTLTREDYRALTPLIYHHVNPYGTFRLDMTARLALDRAEALG